VHLSCTAPRRQNDFNPCLEDVTFLAVMPPAAAAAADRRMQSSCASSTSSECSTFADLEHREVQSAESGMDRTPEATRRNVGGCKDPPSGAQSMSKVRLLHPIVTIVIAL
jgi:hypothetical protein